MKAQYGIATVTDEEESVTKSGWCECDPAEVGIGDRQCQMLLRHAPLHDSAVTLGDLGSPL